MLHIQRAFGPCILFTVAVITAPAQVREPFFFIQGSDPQFGWCESAQNLGRGFAQDIANFEFVVATAKRLRPAFVIVTGDLVDRRGNSEQIAEYLRITGTLEPSMPVYHVAGNHDVSNEPTAANLAEYRSRFGRDYYSFRVGKMAAFVLNSPIIVGPARVPDELAKQEAWFREETAKARRDGMRDLVVFQHHLLFIQSPDEKDSYYTVPAERRRKYLDLFRDAGIGYVFSGHYHRNLVTSYGPLKLVTTTAISCADGPSGIRIAVVKETGIEHRAYDLCALPNRIDLAK